MKPVKELSRETREEKYKRQLRYELSLIESGDHRFGDLKEALVAINNRKLELLGA